MSAREAYREKLERARTMLATLSRLLDEHERDHMEQPDGWGFVGDLGAVNDHLGQAAAALEVTERA